MRVVEVIKDGLAIEATDELASLLTRSWLPLGAKLSTESRDSSLTVRVATGDPPIERPAGKITLSLGTVSLWLPEGGNSGVLHGATACRGVVELEKGRATIEVPGGAGDDEAAEVYSMLTITSALLLGRAGQALVHAAAVISPEGGAWLLTGDTHAGKSTTTANLMNRGWPALSDDQVILREAGGNIVVQGLPRPFHLDEAWGSAHPPLDRRRRVNSRVRWPGQMVESAPLGGLLFPRVVADRPTALEPISSATALTAVIRQSPWLLADKVAAPGLLRLLQRVVSGRRYSLSLGLDTFADAALLEERLLRAMGTPQRSAARPANKAMGQPIPLAIV